VSCNSGPLTDPAAARPCATHSVSVAHAPRDWVLQSGESPLASQTAMAASYSNATAQRTAPDMFGVPWVPNGARCCSPRVHAERRCSLSPDRRSVRYIWRSNVHACSTCFPLRSVVEGWTQLSFLDQFAKLVCHKRRAAVVASSNLRCKKLAWIGLDG
jgi:hypothetical protein